MSLLVFKNFKLMYVVEPNFEKKQYDVLISGVCRPKFTKPGTRVEQQVFFQNYNILPRSGVKAESLRAASENTGAYPEIWIRVWGREGVGSRPLPSPTPPPLPSPSRSLPSP